MATSLTIRPGTVRCMIPAEVGTRPMTEYGTDTPRTDEHGRQLHQVRDLTVVMDGESVTGAAIISTREQRFPAGAIIQPKGEFAVRLRARAESERYATLVATIEAEVWEAVGSAADLLGIAPAANKEGGK